MNKCLLLTTVYAFQLSCVAQQADTLQTADSIHRNNPLTLIVPASLILMGTGIMLDKDADEFFISNSETWEERNEHFINFTNHLDNFLQHAPSATVFILSLSGVRGKHDLSNQLALYVKSEILMAGVVTSLKYTVGEMRPDTGKKNSFPSGHTAQAFMAAAFLSKEYGNKSVWISIGAYTAATAVGVFRVLNNRHWLSDVLVGAGIGMLSTELVYRTHKGRWGKKNRLDVNPYSSYGSLGVSLRYRL